jgi:hypothetical protein
MASRQIGSTTPTKSASSTIDIGELAKQWKYWLQFDEDNNIDKISPPPKPMADTTPPGLQRFLRKLGQDGD